MSTTTKCRLISYHDVRDLLAQTQQSNEIIINRDKDVNMQQPGAETIVT